MKMIVRCTFMVLLIMLCNTTMYAQQKINVVGIVVDENKEPIVGATVTVKGEKYGVVTDINGKYSIKVEKNKTLLYSFLGYQDIEKKITNTGRIDVTLPEKSVLLNEVVAIGYGSIKKKDVTGSIAKVDMGVVSEASPTTLDQILSGRIAGVNILSADAAPGSLASVTIRGGSLSQDASPLFVIDGFPMEDFDLSTIDPKSIESIDILKDASSIAIYGARGANGVIIINTKKGIVGKPRLTYSGTFTYTAQPNMPKMMSPYEYVVLQEEIAQKVGISYYNMFKNMYLDNGIEKRTIESYKNEKGYDWQDILLNSTFTHAHSLQLNGGTLDTKYNVNLGYTNQDGILMGTGMERYNAQIMLDQNLNKAIKVQLKATHSTTKTKSNSVMGKLRQFRPTSGIGGQDLLLAQIDSAMMNGTELEYGVDPSLLINPLQQAQNEVDHRSMANTQINGKVEINFLKDFKFSSMVGATFATNYREYFYNSKTTQGHLFMRPGSVGGAPTVINQNGVNGGLDEQNTYSILNENLLNYRKKFNKNHSLDILAGFTFQHSEYKRHRLYSINMQPGFEYLGLYNLNSGTLFRDKSGYDGSANRMMSYLARANYTLKDRYIFTFNGRADGSSKFYKSKQWGYFPSGAVAWRLSQEPFMKGAQKVISDAKIRLSGGSVGSNRSVSDFAYLLELGGIEPKRGYIFDKSGLQPGMTAYFYSNPSLTWEKTVEYNVGTDLEFFKSRLALTVDFYQRRTKGFLMNVAIPFYAGYLNGANARFENVGSVQNKGIEITLDGLMINKKDWKWGANINFAYNKNKIIRFANGNDILTQSGPDNISQMWIAKQGSNISQFYGFLSDGLYQYDDFYKNANGTYSLKPGIVSYEKLKSDSYPVQPGDRKLKDLNGDGVINDNDRTTLGTPIPPIIGGFSTYLSWKGLTLNAFFQYSLGNKVLNYNRMKFESSGKYWARGNMYASFANRWTPENTNTDIARVLDDNQGGDNTSVNPKVIDIYVEDGSFLRFKTLSLSYQFPKKWIQKMKLTALSMNVIAQNIALFSNYSGQDPEVSNYAGVNQTRGTGYSVVQTSTSYSSMTGGLDNAAYPRSFTLSGGINITF